MKKQTLVALSLILGASVAMSGCATKRYGRMQPLVPAEADAMDCKQIGIEIAKVEGFEQQVADGAKIDWKSVAGFLGDYGIGNTMEKNAAIESAGKRKSELRALQVQKQCNVS